MDEFHWNNCDAEWSNSEEFRRQKKRERKERGKIPVEGQFLRFFLSNRYFPLSQVFFLW